MESRPSLFKRAWAVFSQRPGAYVVITVLPFVVCIGLVILVGRVVVHFVPPSRESWDPLSLWQSMGWGERVLVILAMYASAIVPSYLAARGVSRTVLDAQNEIETPLGSVLLEMLRFVPTAMVYFFVMGIPVSVGGFILVVPGILIATLFALVIPAGADERLGPLGALRHGLALSRRVFGRVLGVYAILFLAAIVLRLVLGVVTAGAEGSPYAALFIALLGLAAGLLALGMVNIAITLIYRDARYAGSPQVSNGSDQSNAQQAKAG